MADNETPRYGERSPSDAYPGPVDGEPRKRPTAAETSRFGQVMTAAIVLIPLVALFVPLSVWLTRLALGG
jgi:hypothetical protein